MPPGYSSIFNNSTVRNIFSGLREKLFEHDDSTGRCHSKSFTAMKGWVPVSEFLLVNSAARRLLRTAGFEGNFFPRFFYSRLCSLTIFGGAGISADNLCPGDAL